MRRTTNAEQSSPPRHSSRYVVGMSQKRKCGKDYIYRVQELDEVV